MCWKSVSKVQRSHAWNWPKTAFFGFVDKVLFLFINPTECWSRQSSPLYKTKRRHQHYPVQNASVRNLERSEGFVLSSAAKPARPKLVPLPYVFPHTFPGKYHVCPACVKGQPTENHTFVVGNYNRDICHYCRVHCRWLFGEKSQKQPGFTLR